MTRFLIAWGLGLLLSISGCVSMFTARTTASYEADGKKIFYESNKDQMGLDATYELYESGAVKAVRIKADKAVTPEAAIAAALQIQSEIIKEVIPLLKAAATKGMAAGPDPASFASTGPVNPSAQTAVRHFASRP